EATWEQARARAVARRVGAQRGERARGGLEGDQARVRTAPADVEREQADVRADVQDAVAVLQPHAVLEIGLLDEDLFVQVLGLVRVQVRDLQPVRERGAA